MGLVRKVLDAATKYPIANGCMAALGASPLAYSIIQSSGKDATYWEKVRWGIPLLAAFGVGAFGSLILNCFTREKDRTHFGDYRLRRNLAARLKNVKLSSPELKPRAVSYNMADAYINIFHPKTSAIVERSRKAKNPLLALDVAMRYFGTKRYDDGLLMLRDAFDWLGGQKPELTFFAKGQYFMQIIASWFTRIVETRAMENYMLRAARAAVLNPEKCWYESSLGKLMADALDHRKKREMYVVHALLATAQQRPDQEQAWADAFRLMRNSKSKRLGESRHPVWALEDSECFSGTFAFKGNPDRAELVNERDAALKLEEILDGMAATPQPLFISSEPHDDLYVYIMRYMHGEVLYDQMLRGDNSGIEKVIPVLARILARYPTTGLPHVSIREKTYKKLKALGAEHMFRHFKPVIDDLENQPLLVINSDRHPEQWQMLDNPYAEVGVLDTEMKEVHQAVLEAANLLSYGGKITPEEKERYVRKIVECLRQEGKSINNPELAHAYEGNDRLLLRGSDNATIHRGLCWRVAWAEPGRNKTREEEEQMIGNVVQAIDDHKRHDPSRHEDYREDYEALREFYPKLIAA